MTVLSQKDQILASAHNKPAQPSYRADRDSKIVIKNLNLDKGKVPQPSENDFAEAESVSDENI